MGHSLLKGTLEVFSIFGEGKLNIPLVRCADIRRNYLPVRMIESATEIVDGIADDNGCIGYNGFVLFGERGAVAGLCVAFKNVGERSMFAEQSVKIADVFRGPINFQ